MKKKQIVTLPNTNISIKTFNYDPNGNSLVHLSSQGKGFSLQLSNFPTLKRLRSDIVNKMEGNLVGDTFSKELAVASKEVVGYIKEFGTKREKGFLKPKSSDLEIA